MWLVERKWKWLSSEKLIKEQGETIKENLEENAALWTSVYKVQSDTHLMEIVDFKTNRLMLMPKLMENGRMTNS